MISLTFDTDWMQSEDLVRFLAEYPFPGVGTFFMHRNYPELHDTHHELCIHPFLGAPEDWDNVLNKLLAETGVSPFGMRTHSTLHSHLLEHKLKGLGFRYTSHSSRLFEPCIKPVRLPWGLWELPIYYMDNLDFTMATYWPGHIPFDPAALDQAVESEDLYVFDFHPLHISLNTPNLDYYLEHQARLKAGESPFKFRYDGQGTGSFFTQLCQKMEARGVKSSPLKEIAASL